MSVSKQLGKGDGLENAGHIHEFQKSVPVAFLRSPFGYIHQDAGHFPPAPLAAGDDFRRRLGIQPLQHFFVIVQRVA